MVRNENEFSQSRDLWKQMLYLIINYRKFLSTKIIIMTNTGDCNYYLL